MTEDPFRYDKWIEAALRGVVRRALEEAATEGLWGNHHFYITYDTTRPGVELPEPLRSQYPAEMTIVIQNEFWGLNINEEDFEVTLSFSDVRTPLRIPFDAITAFADPAVKFGLQLKIEAGATDDAHPEEEEAQALDFPVASAQEQGNAGNNDIRAEEDSDGGKTGEVIALDAFRKK
ncbi:MAG: ClpXP protease specificity-enhancing factor SspB [Rhodospirillales bacterium]|nr:ClpXP protease specificity-enhancing factor SspB [Rhodospirillales bacterium]MCW9040857.1 ClpXP protease specificity-enhancing factor SspB [Rhodospirillales bacterium]